MTRSSLQLIFLLALCSVWALAQQPGVPAGPPADTRPDTSTQQEPANMPPDTRAPQNGAPLPGTGDEFPQTHTSDQAGTQQSARVDDATLERQVHEQLATHGELADVKVSVKDGIVQLEGAVPTKDARKLARDVAHSVPGVRGVREKLTVSANAGQAAKSTTGAEQTGTANPAGNSGIPQSSDRPVNPSPGTSAGAAGQTGTSGAIGAQTVPPQSQTGGLTAEQAEAPDLGGQIETALKSEPTLAGDNIAVKVTDNTIELTGTAASGKEKLTARRIAESYAANRRVVDHITVGGRGQLNPNGAQNPMAAPPK